MNHRWDGRHYGGGRGRAHGGCTSVPGRQPGVALNTYINKRGLRQTVEA